MDDLRDLEQEAELLHERSEAFRAGFVRGMLVMSLLFWAGCCLIALALKVFQ